MTARARAAFARTHGVTVEEWLAAWRDAAIPDTLENNLIACEAGALGAPRRGPASPRARAEANVRASGLVEAVRVTLVQSGTALLWRNNVGQARYGAAVVRYGLGVGSPDLVGILRHEGGRALGVECKDAGGELEYEQACWLRAWTAAGGLGVVARSVEDACAVMVPGPARDAVVERTREEIEAAIARRERRRA